MGPIIMVFHKPTSGRRTAIDFRIRRVLFGRLYAGATDLMIDLSLLRLLGTELGKSHLGLTVASLFADPEGESLRRCCKRLIRPTKPSVARFEQYCGKTVNPVL